MAIWRNAHTDPASAIAEIVEQLHEAEALNDELLAALKALRDECMGFIPQCASQVDAAIAKATGSEE